ncbi:hypothetical protein VSDG_08789 [Cytospora chrysosperma]|uniref:Dystroglycan-type cadherin-like domain-containing protein n=1 Tax=Cytospora chrysosperma TaxID=252740 RepID=A0A423VGM7_CYTCH|nr:hypothetical protein VSDG_08789 [Valsa sordida]
MGTSSSFQSQTRSQIKVAADKVNLNRDLYVAGLDEPAPSLCYYYTYTWIATEGAPFNTPLYPSWGEPGSRPTANPPGNSPFDTTASLGPVISSTVPGGGTGPTTSPTAVAPGTTSADPITLAEGRAFSIDLNAYLISASDVVLSMSTQPNEDFLQLNVAEKTITGTAPEVAAELTVVITVLASTTTNAAYASKRLIGARDVGYAINITLQVQPITAVPITTGNSFAIKLNRYLESIADTVSLVTEPSATWITYDSATQVVSGTVPSTYATTDTNITVNAIRQNGTTYNRFFMLSIEPVQSIPQVTGNTFSLQLREYLLASSDSITSVTLDPTAPWITFSSSNGTLSGTVPTSLTNGTILITVFAGSDSAGLSYSFQLRLDISDITSTTAVVIPIVESNSFGISMAQYFPTSSILTAISTNPTVNWVNLDAAGNRIYGLVPDLTTTNIITVTVNASSAGTKRASALYTRQFSLNVNTNDMPSFNLTLGSQFTVDLGMDLLSVPGDYITSITTDPVSNWLSLDAEGNMITGTVPTTLAAGTSVVVTGNALNPSLGSTYGKQFNLVIAAGQNITVPVVDGEAFRVNLTDYLENPGDSIQPLTISPDVDWVLLNSTVPPYLFGTVPSNYAESEVNVTVSVVSQTTGLTYSILVILDVFESAAVVSFGDSDTFYISLVSLLKTNMDLVESIDTFPTSDWIILDAADRSISGTIPADEPGGSMVNVTVRALSTDASADYTRVFNKIIGSRQTADNSYSVLVSLQVPAQDDANTTSSSTLPPSSTTASASTAPPTSSCSLFSAELECCVINPSLDFFLGTSLECFDAKPECCVLHEELECHASFYHNYNDPDYNNNHNYNHDANYNNNDYNNYNNHDNYDDAAYNDDDDNNNNDANYNNDNNYDNADYNNYDYNNYDYYNNYDNYDDAAYNDHDYNNYDADYNHNHNNHNHNHNTDYNDDDHYYYSGHHNDHYHSADYYHNYDLEELKYVGFTVVTSRFNIIEQQY